MPWRWMPEGILQQLVYNASIYISKYLIVAPIMEFVWRSRGVVFS